MKPAETFGVTVSGSMGVLVAFGLTILKSIALYAQMKIQTLKGTKMNNTTFTRIAMTYFVSTIEVIVAIGASILAGILLA